VIGSASQLSGLTSAFTRRHKNRIKSSISNNKGSTKIHKIRGLTLDQLLSEYKIHKIDYLSIDTEGSEYVILKDFPFKNYDIECIAIENNYHGDRIINLMYKNGYQLTEIIGADEIYLRCTTN
jgi:FkbM family methyltransferase